MINLNSSSLIKLSIIAFDTWEAIVSNFAAAKVLIFKCFSALVVVFLTTILPIDEMAPVAAPLIPKATANGASTPVDNITAPAPSTHIVTPIKTLSAKLIIFDTRKYFLLNASRF